MFGVSLISFLWNLEVQEWKRDRCWQCYRVVIIQSKRILQTTSVPRLPVLGWFACHNSQCDLCRRFAYWNGLSVKTWNGCDEMSFGNSMVGPHNIRLFQSSRTPQPLPSPSNTNSNMWSITNSKTGCIFIVVPPVLKALSTELYVPWKRHNYVFFPDRVNWVN